MVRNSDNPEGTSGGARLVGGGGLEEAMLAPCLAPGSGADCLQPVKYHLLPDTPIGRRLGGTKTFPPSRSFHLLQPETRSERRLAHQMVLACGARAAGRATSLPSLFLPRVF